MKKALYVIVIMILIIAFCVSAFLVARYVLEGKKQADRYEDLANIKNQAQTSVPTQATKPSTATEPSKPGFEVISDPTVEGGILLDYAELQAERKIPMSMEDWAKRLDGFLEFNGNELLTGPGKISAEQAKLHAETEYEKYRVIQDRLYESDFDRFLMLEQEVNHKDEV